MSLAEKLSRESRFSDKEIRAQLERMLAHAEFQATDRMRDFLRFVVEQTLDGNSRQLKGFTIAMEVFGRGDDFDAAHDPVVRIQAGRLRRAIERYYLVAGGDDAIVIDIPKGGYVPVFRAREPELVQSQSAPEHEHLKTLETWPSLLVLPFDNPGDRQDLAQIALGLATELGIELANSGDLRVMLSNDASRSADDAHQQTDFVVWGSLRADGSAMKLVVQLTAASSQELLWSDSLKSELKDGRVIEFQERTAAAIAARIAGQHGAIFRAVTGVTTSQPRDCTGSYGALLKGHAYHQSFDPDLYQVAFEALTEAYSQDSDSGLLSSMLAAMYIDNLTLELFDPEMTPLGETLRLAHEGVRLAPRHELCRLILARAHLLNNDLSEGLEEVAAARALNPNSILFMDVAGYLMGLLGEVERGATLVRQAMRLNPFYRAVTRYTTWLDCLRRGDFEAALEETEWFRGVGFFWAPLARAATLGQLGRIDEARVAIDRVLMLKPDFPERGHALIRQLVKRPAEVTLLLQGLAAGGLTLEKPHGTRPRNASTGLQ